MRPQFLAAASVAAVALATVLARAEIPSVHASHTPINIAVLLDLDAARAEVVQTILENSHQRRMAALEAMRADTDSQLAAVLTADELARLKAALPPPWPGDGARKHGTPM